MTTMQRQKTALLLLLLLAAAAMMFSPAVGEDEGAPPPQPSAEQMARTMEAMFLSRQGEHGRAADIFSQLGERLQSPDLMREAYRETLVGGDAAKAIHYARRWQAFGGGDPSLRALSRLFLQTGQENIAYQLLKGMMLSGRQSDLQLFQVLRAAPKERAGALGRKLFNDTAEGNLLLARLAMQAADWPTASFAVERGLSHGDRRDELNLLRMQIQQNQNGAAAAMAAAEKYLAMQCPGAEGGCDEQSLLYAYSLFVGGGDWKTALGGGGDSGQAALAAGRFAESAEDLARAQRYYQKVRHRFFHARLGLARVYRDSGQLRKALEVLEEEGEVSEREFVLRETTAADILEKLNGSDEATARIIRARAAVPGNHTLMYQHALLTENGGDVDGAVRILESITRLFPNSAEGWNALGYVLADHNRRLAEAERFIKIALKISPDAANILDSLGWVYYRQGRLEEARQYLLRASQKTDSSEIFAHLGEVHWRLGDYDLAKRAFDSAKQLDPDNRVLLDTLRRLNIAD